MLTETVLIENQYRRASVEPSNMKKQSLNIITLFMLTVLSFSSLFSQQKGGEIISNDSESSGHAYAVVVGISDYQDEEIPDLHYADKDAMAFADFLRSPSGGELDADHLKLLLNEEATLARFATELTWLLEVAKESDRVIIYFSGHGDVEKANSFQPGYLLCWDALSRVYMGGGAFGLNTFRGVIASLSLTNKAKVTVITDACRSGKLSGNQIGGSRLTNTDLAQSYANETKILSCQPEEFSIEGEQWGGGRGAFSYHLINGLYGLADQDGDHVVNVMEIRSYLEQKIPPEVAPFDQLPVTVGNSREVLSIVDPDVLKRVKEIDEGKFEIFGALATKGIVSEILQESDSSIREDYDAFENALANNQFFSPIDDCAEYYYKKLIKEPALERLHSAMNRNYAAALQDDAQQVLRTMLKSGLTLTVTMDKESKEVYADYPQYINRAVELLGKDHYMHDQLLARKYYFQGLMGGEPENRRKFYQKAIQANPELAQAYTSAMNTFTPDDLDSALLYFHIAKNLAPTWVKPYTQIAWFYRSKLNDPIKALELLKEAQLIDSQSVYLNYRIAQNYKSQKMYKLAEKHYLMAIEGKSSDVCFPCVHTELGTLYRTNLNQPVKAIQQYKLSLESDSDPSFCYPCGYINLANIYGDLGKVDKQKEAFKNALELDSLYDVTYIKLAIFEMGLNNYEKAKKYIQKAIKYQKAPRGESYSLLGCIYGHLNQGDSTLHYFEKALNIDSTSIWVLDIISNYYLETKTYELSIEFAQECIRYDSAYTPCYKLLGDAYLSSGQFEQAQNIYQFLLSIDSTNITRYIDVGVCYLNMEDPTSALNIFTKAFEIDSTNYILNLNLAATNNVLGNEIALEKYLLKSVDYSGQDRRPGIFLADFYRDKGRLVEAAVQYKKLYLQNKQDSYAGMQLGNIYNRLKRYTEAEKIFREMTLNMPDNAQAFANLAVVCKNLGKVDEAEIMYKKALSIRPNYVFVLQRLGQIYRSQGNFQKSIEMYARVVNADPGKAPHLNNLGDAYFIIGNFDKAEQLLDKAIKEDTTHWLTYLTKAQILQAKHEWEASVPIINKAIKLYPDFPGNYTLRALAYAHLDIEPLKAEADIEHSISNGSGFHDVCLYIAQYYTFKGDTEKAYIYLEKMCELGNGEPYLKNILDREPDFDVLREEERWKEMMKKYYGGMEK